jgi:hypothetical protein
VSSGSSININRLLDEKLVPADSEVISIHNNLVLISKREAVVSRIGKLSLIAQREDPGDITYSHRLAWVSSDVAPVVRPVSEDPIQKEDIIISSFPLREKVDWSTCNPESIHDMLSYFNGALTYVSERATLRDFDISEYAQQRLDYAYHHGFNHMEILDNTQRILSAHQMAYPFHELTDNDPALVHGDLHAGNVVAHKNSLEIIDLDSVARGPKLYDIASWRLRQEISDVAPVDRVVDISSKLATWDDESYRALIGWKIISSMTNAIRYEKSENLRSRIVELGRCAHQLDAQLSGKVDK